MSLLTPATKQAARKVDHAAPANNEVALGTHVQTLTDQYNALLVDFTSLRTEYLALLANLDGQAQLTHGFVAGMSPTAATATALGDLGTLKPQT